MLPNRAWVKSLYHFSNSFDLFCAESPSLIHLISLVLNPLRIIESVSVILNGFPQYTTDCRSGTEKIVNENHDTLQFEKYGSTKNQQSPRIHYIAVTVSHMNARLPTIPFTISTLTIINHRRCSASPNSPWQLISTSVPDWHQKQSLW